MFKPYEKHINLLDKMLSLLNVITSAPSKLKCKKSRNKNRRSKYKLRQNVFIVLLARSNFTAFTTVRNLLTVNLEIHEWYKFVEQEQILKGAKVLKIHHQR